MKFGCLIWNVQSPFPIFWGDLVNLGKKRYCDNVTFFLSPFLKGHSVPPVSYIFADGSISVCKLFADPGLSGAFRALQYLQGSFKSLPGLLSEAWEVHLWQPYHPDDPPWSSWPKACLGLVHTIVRFFLWLFLPDSIPQSSLTSFSFPNWS